MECADRSKLHSFIILGNVAVLGGPIEGLEYRLASCGGLEFGYNGLGIDAARDDGKPV
jgi:hypothetical protein